MKKVILFTSISLVFLCLALSAYATSYSESFQIEVSPLQYSSVDGMSIFRIEGYGSTQDYYMPILPVKTFYYEIPGDAENVQVTLQRLVSEGMVYNISSVEEALPPLPSDYISGNSGYKVPERKEHNLESYPEQYFLFNGVKVLNGHHLVSITIFPVRYYFTSRQAEFLSGYTFRLYYDTPDGVSTSIDDSTSIGHYGSADDGDIHDPTNATHNMATNDIRKINSKKSKDARDKGKSKPTEVLASEIIENYEDYAYYADYTDNSVDAAPEDAASGIGTAGDTSEEPGDPMDTESFSLGTSGLSESVDIKYVIITTSALGTALEPLAEWKSQKGVPAKIYLTEDIYAGYSGYDSAEKIRNFLVELEQTDDIDWVLLAGDVADVPTRSAYTNDGEDVYTPTDYYYADLSGSYSPYDWDQDDDNIYGEVADDLDWLPEAYVGRLSTSNLAQMQTMVSNIISYEKSPAAGSWTSKTILAGGQSDETTDEAYLMKLIKEDFMDGRLTSERLNYLANYPRDYLLDFSNFQARVSAGASTVSWAGHGSYTLAVPAQGIAAFVSTATSPSNGEMMPVIYANSCLTGAFDVSTSLGEDIIRDWGIGFVGATRVSWYYQAWDLSKGYNQAHTYRFNEQLVGNNKYRPGTALYDSKVDYMNDFAGSYAHPDIGPEARKNVFTYNLLGDPELNTWLGTPAEINIEYTENFVPNQDTNITVTVTFSGNSSAVPGATVTLFNGDDVYATTSSDASGIAAFSSVNTNGTDPITVTVTKQNIVPRQGNITPSQMDVILLSPLGQSYINPSSLNFTYSVSSGREISSCRLLIDGIETASDYTITEDTIQTLIWEEVTGGSHNWSVECTDSSGFKNALEEEQFFVTLMTEFDGSSTDLTGVDMENITNLVIENSAYGAINFSEDVNLSQGADLDSIVTIKKNLIIVNSTMSPALNKSAILTIWGVYITNPVIMRDGAVCDDCVIIEEHSGYIRFSVDHFSTYTVAAADVGASGRMPDQPLIPGNVTAQGGNVTRVDLKSNTSTDKWQGFYGNVYGKIQLGLDVNSFYEFGIVNMTAVYASQNQSFNFAAMQATTAAQIDTTFNFAAAEDIDQAVDFLVDDSITNDGVTTTGTTLADGNFQCYAVDQGVNVGVGSYAFGGIVQNAGAVGFDGSTWGYELLVPIDAGTPTYYFFMSI